MTARAIKEEIAYVEAFLDENRSEDRYYNIAIDRLLAFAKEKCYNSTIEENINEDETRL